MARQHKKIVALVVDDEPIIRRFIRRVLKGYFPYCDVKEASDGTNAAQTILKTPPDLVIVDICLPGVGGIELCRLINRHADLKNVSVLVMTGHPVSDIRNELSHHGVKSFLLKPFDKESLLEALQKTIP